MMKTHKPLKSDDKNRCQKLGATNTSYVAIHRMTYLRAGRNMNIVAALAAGKLWSVAIKSKMQAFWGESGLVLGQGSVRKRCTAICTSALFHVE